MPTDLPTTPEREKWLTARHLQLAERYENAGKPIAAAVERAAAELVGR